MVLKLEKLWIVKIQDPLDAREVTLRYITLKFLENDAIDLYRQVFYCQAINKPLLPVLPDLL